MGYPSFKLLHLMGILFLFSGIGGMAFMFNGESGDSKSAKARLTRILHGAGLVLILIGGVMMVYSLGLDGKSGVPLWVKLKLLIWISFGPLILLFRRPNLKRFALPIALLLGLAASFLAIFKPF